MGLRFRKSISLCKGVRLNFGKTGASVTFGQKGYHKTISTSGRVTTSIGIPGTGIYYTDTKQIGQPRGQRSRRGVDNSTLDRSAQRTRQPVQQIPSARDEYSSGRTEREGRESEDLSPKHVGYVTHENTPGSILNKNDSVLQMEFDSSAAHMPSIEWNETRYSEVQGIDYSPSDEPDDFFLDPLISINEDIGNVGMIDRTEELTETYISKSLLPEIYSRCDQEILWDDILLGNSADDLYMDEKTWNYCRRVAKLVIAGNIDTYLQVITDLAPVEDLLMYASDFEFGTDRPNVLEVEFVVYPEELLKEGKWDPLLGDYVSSVALRVARDLFSLLPINKIAVHAICESKDIFSGIFYRSVLNETNYNLDISTILKNMQCNYCRQFDDPEISRLQV